MKITATITNKFQQNHVSVETNGNRKKIEIPSKSEGQGSVINGGELLFLALATCFCNDIYREAARREIKIEAVNAKVFGKFGGEGEAASNIKYKVDIQSDAPPEEISKLILDVERIAEIHNTLRKGVSVSLVDAQI